MVQGSYSFTNDGRYPKFLKGPIGFPLGNWVYETYKGNPKILYDVSRPFGKAMFVIHNMRNDKEFFIHITNYQAQINSDKIKNHFENFKKAFYPHLEDFEKKQSAAINKKILDEAAKGPIAFKVLPTVQEQKKRASIEKRTGMKFTPTARTR